LVWYKSSSHHIIIPRVNHRPEAEAQVARFDAGDAAMATDDDDTDESNGGARDGEFEQEV